MSETSFHHRSIKLDSLREKAYNLRWASLPEGVIPLSSGDSDFPVAEPISKALTEFINDGYFPYPPANGYPFFLQAVAQYYLRRNVDVNPDLVIATNSAASAINVVCKALLSLGDEVIIMEPVDFLFRYNIELAGGQVISYNLAIDPSEEVDVNRLGALINQKTKAIFLCNPHNPTGKVFTRLELLAIGELALKHNLFLVSDEIWSEIVYSDSTPFTSISSLGEEISRRTFIINGFSKSNGLAGLRSGYTIAPTFEWLERINEHSEHSSTINGSNSLAQVAATAAMKHCSDWQISYLNHLENMRNLAHHRLNKIRGFQTFKPHGCFLAFVNIEDTGMNSETIADKLLTEGKVKVVPGLPKWFGRPAEGHIRISFSTSSEMLNESLDRIENVMGAL